MYSLPPPKQLPMCGFGRQRLNWRSYLMCQC